MAPDPATRTWQNHTGPILDSVKGFDVIECGQCGFKHIVPIPTPEELEAVYRHEYYIVEKPLYLERHREDLEWWNMVYSERFDTFEELLPPGRRRILDVGSGPGFFLLHGKQRGWLPVGIEPSGHAASYSRDLGLNIVNDFLDERTARELGTFDVVHMREVLEHIPDPVSMISLSRELLDRGGILFLSVPNDYNPFQSALRKVCAFEPWWLAPPQHINYFDFHSLGRLVQSQGFEVILEETSFPIDIFLLMGDNYVGNDTLGRQCHMKRKMLEHNLAEAGLSGLKQKLYRSFASLGIGREVQIYARKR
ncbi:MAG TPA: class I SAM-dependent methyltransferase [Deltaproteobacteria bacterium]|nr:class I SAM-dependent methyltransferase [Deltaproteobacteria bacterium]HPR53743.1 class I SAM-dependent methyltransferase [Deltaproteobacteria bacterium]HXK46760.1 class I SAM-dependent methyltransferase [Deltaproteobacteria bacterium]